MSEEERVNSLLGTSPDENRGKDREEVVKTELEDYDNGNLTVTEVTSRFGLSVFFLIFNLIVSVFAIMLTGSMLLSQILFIISAMFLPISLLISMIPAFSGTSRRAVISLFNTIMLRVGTTLLTTFVLVLSSLAYTIANGKPFVVVVLLQVIVFAGVYMERDKLLGMIGLRDEDTGRIGRAMTNRPRRTISRAVRERHCHLRRVLEWESALHSAMPCRVPREQLQPRQVVKTFSRRRRISANG